MNLDFTAIDFETATFNRDSICQVGIAVVEQCKIVERIKYFVRPPGNTYSQRCINVHGIRPDNTEDSEPFDLVYEKIFPYIQGKNIVGHNITFDISCLKAATELYKLKMPTFKAFCTLNIYRENLESACFKHGIKLLKAHDALQDAEASALLMIKDIQRNG